MLFLKYIMLLVGSALIAGAVAVLALDLYTIMLHKVGKRKVI